MHKQQSNNIPLKTRILAILKSPLFKFYLSTFLWLSIGCLALCLLGNLFDLNASETAGFFQGIGTIISIICGFLFINYERDRRLLDQKREKIQHILNLLETIHSITSITLHVISFNEKLKNRNNALIIGLIERSFSNDKIELIKKQFDVCENISISINPQTTFLMLIMHDRLIKAESLAQELYSAFVEQRPPENKQYENLDDYIRKIKHYMKTINSLSQKIKNEL